MTVLSHAPRNTGGFSLDEAARAVRTSMSDEAALCPVCSAPMYLVVGDEEHDPVWMFRCEDCGRGVVFMRFAMPQRRRRWGRD